MILLVNILQLVLFVAFHDLPTSSGARTLFVVLEGFRYDYVKLFSTPTIGKLLRSENSFFHPSIKPVFPTTSLPNLASLMTGNYSNSHGITDQGYFLKGGLKKIYPSHRLFWSKVRELGTIWDAYYSSFEKEDDIPVQPALVTWPFSKQLDGLEKRRFIHINDAPDLDSKFKAIDRLFVNGSTEFVSVYTTEPGQKAMIFGPESKEVKASVEKIDEWIGKLAKKFEGDTNIIIASTPGYLNTSVASVIHLDQILKKESFKAFGKSPLINIIPNEGEEINVFQLLDSQSPDNFQTYYKNNVPPEWKYSLRQGVRILLVASKGKVFEDYFQTIRTYSSREKLSEPLLRTYGLNGYGDFDSEKTILIGLGPAFLKKDSAAHEGERETEVVDVYPLLCHVLGLEIPENRDGSLESFLGSLTNSPQRAIQKIKEVIKKMSNSPGATAVIFSALVCAIVFVCVIIACRKKNKDLELSYSYTQVRNNRRLDGDQADDYFENVEFLDHEDEEDDNAEITGDKDRLVPAQISDAQKC